MIKIGIFPSSSQIGTELISALSNKKEISTVKISSNELDITSDLFLVDVHDENFINQLNLLIDREGIDLIYPAHDLVIKKLYSNLLKINCEIIGSAKKTIDLTLNKKTTYEFLTEFDFTPLVYSNVESIIDYPVFVKPRFSFGSKNAYKVSNETMLREIIYGCEDDWVICEHLPGNEYTVDCYTNDTGYLSLISPRLRLRIRQGISSETTIVKDPKIVNQINKIAENINSKIQFRGAWFFQVKENPNSLLKLLEIAPRLAGSSSLTRLRYANTPYLTILEFYLKKKIVIDSSNPNSIDRFVETRKITYFSSNKLDFPKKIFVDFDDTLTKDQILNKKLLTLLYFMKLNDVKLNLITRNQDIYSSLETLNVDKELFEEIIEVRVNMKKSSLINVNGEKSIFIDDSYRERSDVKIVKKIDSFDVSEAISYLEGLYVIESN